MDENSPAWPDAVKRAIEILIAFAKTEPYERMDPYYGYQEFEIKVGLPRGYMKLPEFATPFLRDVCFGIKETPLTSDDILLSSLVAYKTKGVPGSGFFRMALDIGFEFNIDDDDEKLRFVQVQRQRVFYYYQQKQS